MKQIRRRILSDVYLGSVFFPDFVSNPENSFSKSTQKLDEYPRSRKPIGKLNPRVQAMGMKLEEANNMLTFVQRE